MRNTHADDVREINREERQANAVTPRLASLFRRLQMAQGIAMAGRDHALVAKLDAVLEDLEMDRGFREVDQQRETEILTALGLVAPAVTVLP